MSKQKKGVKYCPQCGAELKEEDKYCTKCGYSFEKRNPKVKVKNLIILIIIIIIAWVAIRLLTKNPILPKPLLDLFAKNVTG